MLPTDRESPGLGRGEEVKDSSGVIAPPPLIFAGGLVVGLLLGVAVQPPALPVMLAWPVGGLLILAGLALGFSFISAFRRAQTPVDPRQATRTIVTTGAYRFTRNPAYLGMALIYTGIALATGGTWALITLIPTLVLVDRGVIAREERYLEQKFGAEYTTLKTRVRRWL